MRRRRDMGRGPAAVPPWLASGHALRRRRAPRPAWRRPVFLLLLGIGVAVLAARLDPLPPPLSGTSQAADGDSLRLAGERVRLLGIDAPELDQACTRADGSQWSCGEAARRQLAGLVAGAATTCLPAGRDRYDRILATCSASGSDLGAGMVAAGLALSSSGYPSEEAAARAAGRGIWAGSFTPPRQWRRETDEAAVPGLAEAAWNWFRELTGARSLR